MKTSLTLLTLISLTPLAQAAPVEYPSCVASMKVRDVPSGVQIAYNRDCTEIYVLPPDQGPNRVRAVAQPAADLPATCAHINQIQEAEVRSGRELNRAISDMMAEDLLDKNAPARIEKLDALIARKKELTQKFVDEMLGLAAMPASTVHFTFWTGQAEAIATIKAANPTLSVVPMPLKESWISLSEVHREDVDLRQLPAVLSTQFEEEGTGPAPGTRAFIEGIGVRVVLSPMGACGSGYDQHLMANLTYKYEIDVLGQKEERFGTSGLY